MRDDTASLALSSPHLHTPCNILVLRCSAGVSLISRLLHIDFHGHGFGVSIFAMAAMFVGVALK